MTGHTTQNIEQIDAVRMNITHAVHACLLVCLLMKNPGKNLKLILNSLKAQKTTNFFMTQAVIKDYL